MIKTTLFKKTLFFICLISIGASGQNQRKTYKETFNVGDEAVLVINTSHADIEFETWNKKEVVIEATVELTDVSEKEAARYFEKNPVKIMGNSQKIEVSTAGGNSLFTSKSFGELDYHFVMPEVGPVIVDVPEIHVLPKLFEMHEMPPLPPMHFHKFDHDAYKKDGEKYMKKWQKEFAKGFDKEYEKKIEEWGKRMEEQAERMQERSEALRAKAEERTQRLHERQMEMAERQKEMQQRRIAIINERSEVRKHKDSSRFLFMDNDSIKFGGPNIFYFNADGKEGNIKINKTIKIKMPKSVKLKMNVRHGEVKLAENTKNLNATLSHASLFATNIDGEDTTIVASYTPVSVQQWNYGQLQADYSDHVDLREVRNLVLKSTSSDITIDHLLDNLNANNSFGPLRIKSISNNFNDLDVTLRNAELIFELPKTACSIYINGTSSTLSTPEGLKLYKTKNKDNTVHKGYHLKTNSNKSIIIDSDYSEVVVRE